jgi:sirohydrochlorin ferrochelatase
MRPARLNSPGVPLVAVAHGSKDPRAAATVSALISLLRDRTTPSLSARAAYLGHSAPSLAQVLSGIAASGSGSSNSGDVVLVPLLLTEAYHAVADIPSQAAAAIARLPGLRVRQSPALGPHPLLLAALERRLTEAYHGPRAQTAVVLAAAGSSDPVANASVAALAAQWQATGGWRRVVPAYASAASPSPAQAVRALSAEGGPVVVATYLLAPGHFSDKVAAAAREAGAAAISAPLGAAPEVADIIAYRYLSAAPVPLPGEGPPDRGGTPVRILSGSARTPLRNQLSWAPIT